MQPTIDQVRMAAYERWLNRGGIHGYHESDWLGAEKECHFFANYQTIVEFYLPRGSTRVLGSRSNPSCRLCERGTGEVAFGAPCAAILGADNGGRLLTAEVCADCQSECLAPLAEELRRFWERSTRLTLGAYKALVATAILIMPARELAYFPDTIEWVNNPDIFCDSTLFNGSSCRIYSTLTDRDATWVSLARRVDDDVALPYLVFFMAESGFVLQVDIPLSLRDEDFNGIEIRSPERSWVYGRGSDYHESACSWVTVRPAAVHTISH